MLVRSAPFASGLFFAVSFVSGVAPALVVIAFARLAGLAPQLPVSASARAAAGQALLLVAGALVASRLAGSLPSYLYGYVSLRYEAAFDALRMRAACDLPGLEHFESPELADRLQAASWAARAPRLFLNYVTSMAHWGVSAVASLVILGRVGWWAPALVATATGPLVIKSWRQAAERSRVLQVGSAMQRYADYHARLALDPAAAMEVRVFGIDGWLRDRQQRLWSTAFDPMFAALSAQLRDRAIVVLVAGSTIGVPLAVTMVGLARGDATVATLTAVVLATGELGVALRYVIGWMGELRESARFLPDAHAMVHLAEDDPRLATSGRVIPPQMPESGLGLESVRFAYPGTDMAVLDGVDLTIPAGSSLALVGENGAGKSTLVKLLCRFYDPDDGRITLDGVDLRDFDLAELRRRVAVVFQDFLRLPVSAADNVATGCVEHADHGPRRDAAAQLAGVNDVLARLPEGWDTVLDRRFGGVDLSGGEWQRLALARALVTREGRGAPLLILDEPTAALDVRIEHDLYERFASLTAGATTLLVSHRFSTVRMADRIAVLERGRIIEHGDHTSLAGAGGRYAELFELQARRFREKRPRP